MGDQLKPWVSHQKIAVKWMIWWSPISGNPHVERRGLQCSSAANWAPGLFVLLLFVTATELRSVALKDSQTKSTKISMVLGREWKKRPPKIPW